MRVLIVEDHALVREGLRMMIDGGDRFESCIECASLGAAVDEARRAGDELALVLMDLGLPDAGGLETLNQFRAAFPEVPVLVVSGGDDAALIDGAFALGARGYVPKSSSPAALRAAVDTVLRGELYVPPHVLPSRAADPPPPVFCAATSTRLTRRQQQVLVLIARGLSNKEIAGRLDMSASTVRVHVTAILRALGVENRTQAATSATARVLLADC